MSLLKQVKIKDYTVRMWRLVDGDRYNIDVRHLDRKTQHESTVFDEDLCEPGDITLEEFDTIFNECVEIARGIIDA